MNSDLFFKWFRDTFIPHSGSARPVLLVLDNHESHISIEVIQLARANRIEILGFPAHTTHILQPLDVSINGQQTVEAGRPGKKRAKKNVCKIGRLADPESGEGVKSVTSGVT